MSGSTTKGKPGYFDPSTQENRDWFKNQLMGTPTLIENPNYDPNYSSKNPFTPRAGMPTGDGGGLNRGGMYDAQRQKNYAAWEADAAKKYGKYTEGARSGGLFDQFKNVDPTIFGPGGGVYNPTDFSANKFSFNAPQLAETKVDPKMWQNYSDTITKGARRTGAANIQAAQDAAAYQGRGGGDLADFRAQQENRNVNDSTADALRGLMSERMGQEFQDRQGVNRFNAEGQLWQQEKQAGENLQRNQFDEASKQFAANFGSDYKKGALSEKLGNIQGLQQLLQIIGAFNESGQMKPTSSGKSFGL